MESKEVRRKFLDFFKARGHAIVPSASLVPENDPTTLFTGSGMQPMIPYLLGAKHPLGTRIADSQKSFRAEDIDEVGDNRHTTFFEMLGNWSLGDYWKQEQLSWFFEFLTREIRIPKEKLWVTCFAGDEKLNLPPDNESAEIWKSLGIPQERIRFYDSKKNWWSRSGPPSGMPAGEPGGPDSEVFYEFTQVEHDKQFGENCHPNCDCGRFLEIGNSVFMEYKKMEDPSAGHSTLRVSDSMSSGQAAFEKLAQRNVDFGGGLERITAAANNDPDIFHIDAFMGAVHSIERSSEKLYEDKQYTKSFRIISDHIRAAVFMMSDGIAPSNTGRGYVLRRLVRRAVRYADGLNLKQGTPSTNILSHVSQIADMYVRGYMGFYPDLKDMASTVYEELEKEEEKFRKTLAVGMKEFEKAASVTDGISGVDAFLLFTTYGFPFELTLELASERGLRVDKAGFEKEMLNHQELSRTASAGTFKGGLADTSEKTTQLHTTHHLLLKALQIVLGPNVKQRGSNITSERLRMDFSHDAKMTDEQKKEVERIVNEKISEDLPVIHSELPKEEAEKLGAEHEFGQKYPDRVSIYSIGPKSATPEDQQFDKAYSIEFCGGPHMKRTGDIKGVFKIAKEEAISAGVRRIRGVVE